MGSEIVTVRLQDQLAAMTYRSHARGWAYLALVPGFALCALDERGPSPLAFPVVLLWLMAAAQGAVYEVLAWRSRVRGADAVATVTTAPRPVRAWIELALLDVTRAAGASLVLSALWPGLLPVAAVAWSIRVFAVSAAGVLVPALRDALSGDQH